MKRISFDYDGTLTRPRIRAYAKLCKRLGYDIHILTSRQNDITSPDYLYDALGHDFFCYRGILYCNDEVFALAEELGISEENIHFNPGGFESSGRWKSTFFRTEHEEGRKYILHLDDDPEVIQRLNKDKYQCWHEVTAVSCFKTAPWVDKCNILLADTDWAAYLALKANS